MTAKVTFNAAKISRAMAGGIKDGVEAINIALLGRIQERLTKPGTGKKYPPAKTGPNTGFPKYRSAAEGRPPAVQTARLLQSWTIPTTRPRKFKGGYTSTMRQVSVGDGPTSPVKYGFFLETKNGKLGEGRHPFLGGKFGAIAITQRQAQKIFDYYFKRAIRKAGGKS